MQNEIKLVTQTIQMLWLFTYPHTKPLTFFLLWNTKVDILMTISLSFSCRLVNKFFNKLFYTVLKFSDQVAAPNFHCITYVLAYFTIYTKLSYGFRRNIVHKSECYYAFASFVEAWKSPVIVSAWTRKHSLQKFSLCCTK